MIGLFDTKGENMDKNTGQLPEGMEWPRYDTGEPVGFGDEFENARGGSSVLRTVLIKDCRESLGGDYYWKLGKGKNAVTLKNGERVKRPAPKAFDADGVEIRVGEALYYVDGREQKVNTVARITEGLVQFGRINEAGYVTYCVGACIPPDQLTHRAPVLAADGKPLREGETVWGVDSDTRYTVEEITDQLTPIKCRSKLGFTASLYPSQLTHERLDSFQKLWDDLEYRYVSEDEFLRRAKAMARQWAGKLAKEEH